MSDSFEYRAQARNPVGYLAFAIGLAVVFGGRWLEISTATSVLGIIVVLTLTIRLSLNPRSGFRIDTRMVEVFGPGFHRMIPLAKVESVRISQGYKGLCCDFSLSNGEAISVPPPIRIGPAALSDALRLRGIAVIN